jgi:uncharacterized membrane protein YoaK (UPF0700 family)
MGLTAVAGFVDIFGYLALYRVFVANMSGNSVDVGLGLARRDWQQVFHRGVPIAGFVAGLIACGLAIEAAHRCGVRRVLGLSLTLEALCLVAWLVLGMRVLGPHPHPTAKPGAAGAILVALSAFAMGTQNASLRAAGVLNVYTTHVTGTLTRMSYRFVQFLFALHGRRRSSTPLLHHPQFRQAVHLATLWVGYVAGAVAGGWFWMDFGVIAFVAPIAAIAIIAGLSML